MVSMGKFLLLSFWVLFATTSAKPTAMINLNDVLLDAGPYHIFRTLLTASTVAAHITEEPIGAGSTLLVPSDAAFLLLSDDQNARLQSLPALGKAMALRLHVLGAYYPLKVLRSIVNPEQPTLATELTSAGNFTLSLSKVNGSFTVDSGVTIAGVTKKIYDKNPFAVYGISSVLLPPELFRQ